jgi:hypothetical protein
MVISSDGYLFHGMCFPRFEHISSMMMAPASRSSWEAKYCPSCINDYLIFHVNPPLVKDVSTETIPSSESLPLWVAKLASHVCQTI